MGKRILTALMTLALACGLAPAAALADEAAESADEGSLVLDKWVEEAGGGQFKLVLESYATGTDGTVAEEPLPLDVVLVLDESGSMNDELIEGCGDDQKDVKVAAEGHLLPSNDDFPDGDRSQKLFVGHKVFSDDLDTSRTYTVVYPEASAIGDATREVSYCDICQGWFSIADHAVHHQIAQWFPFESEGEKVTGRHDSAEDWEYQVQFYERCGQTGREVLQEALSGFLESFSEKSNPSGGDAIDNRIAIVGYGQGASYVNANGTRSKVYADQGDDPGGPPVSGYETLAERAWCNASQLSDEAIGNLVSGVLANGNTPTHLGVEAAELAFEHAPATEDEDRAKVMILFTDGAPGANYVNFGPGGGSVSDWVTPAIESAKRMKDDGVTVYSVGLFPSANGYGAEEIRYDVRANGQGTDGFFQNANCFLHLVSSNFPYATGVTEDLRGAVSPDYLEGANSYYLGTENAEQLSAIFDQISEDVMPGDTAITLDESAELRDVIADDFRIADASLVTAWTESYQGGDLDEESSWGKDEGSVSDISGGSLEVKVDGDAVVVTGFDYSEHFVHMEDDEPKGKKLVVEIMIEPSDTTLGGLKLPTNDPGAGVYENDGAETPVEEFPLPHVDLPTSITVKKVVKGIDSGDETFTFSASGTGAAQNGGDDYVNVPASETGPGESNYLELERGDLDEVFALKDDGSHIIDGLIEGTELTINETEALGYVPVVTVGESDTPLQPNENGGYTVEITPGTVITFTNVKYAIQVTKVDRDTQKPLVDAAFKLERSENDEWFAVGGPESTNEDGHVVWSNLQAGLYRITETSAPKGYVLNDDPIVLSVPDADEDKDGTVEVTMKNVLAPATGGGGTALFTIGGAVLLACAVGIFLFFHRRR